MRLSASANVKNFLSCKRTKSVWETTDIKDLYVKDGRGTKPLLEVLSDLAKHGVEIRLIHTKEQGSAFRQDFDKYPALIEGMERILCPRVHFKIIVFDLKTAYVGSANLTGAGLGMKGENTRNFEAGVLSRNKDFVKNAVEQFDSVWMRAHCKGCRRKEFCGDPIGCQTHDVSIYLTNCSSFVSIDWQKSLYVVVSCGMEKPITERLPP